MVSLAIGRMLLRQSMLARRMRIYGEVSDSGTSRIYSSGNSRSSFTESNRWSSRGTTPVEFGGSLDQGMITKTVNDISAQRATNSRARDNIQVGIQKLTAANSTLTLGKSLLQQARELASTANDAGADRTAINNQVNQLLAQAKQALQGATFGGKPLFSGSSPEIQVQLGDGVRGSFGVSLTTNITVGPRLEKKATIVGDADGVPQGFDWQAYIDLNPDVEAWSNSESWARTQYRDWGFGEMRPAAMGGPTESGDNWWAGTTFDPNLIPEGFDWQGVLNANSDLRNAGIDTEVEVKRWYATTGRLARPLPGQKFNYVRPDNPVQYGTRMVEGGDEWTRIEGSNLADSAAGIARGIDGSLFTVRSGNGGIGNGQSGNGGWDAVLTKYGADGSSMWTRVLGSAQDEEVRSVAASSDGSVYMAGYTKGNLDGQVNSGTAGGTPDAFVSRYNSDGTRAWTRTIGNGVAVGSWATASGNDGSVYVVGDTAAALDGQTFSGGNDAFITKFAANGSREWTRMLGTSGYERATAVTTGTEGSIYVAGYTTSSLDGQANLGSSDAFIAKYRADGTEEWTKLIGSVGIERAEGIAAGSDGSIYVSGSTSGNLDGEVNRGGFDNFVTKYSADGTKQWTKLVGSSEWDQNGGITVANDGAVFLTGTTSYKTGNLEERDAFVTRLAADGTNDWTKVIRTGAWDFAKGITTGTDGAVYVNGMTTGGLDGEYNNGATESFIKKISPQKVTSSMKTGLYESFSVDLSTQRSTAASLEAVDSALSYFTTASRKVSAGLIRANRTGNYLSASMNLLDARVARLRG
jgi:hypothetical protein